MCNVVRSRASAQCSQPSAECNQSAVLAQPKLMTHFNATVQAPQSTLRFPPVNGRERNGNTMGFLRIVVSSNTTPSADALHLHRHSTQASSVSLHFCNRFMAMQWLVRTVVLAAQAANHGTGAHWHGTALVIQNHQIALAWLRARANAQILVCHATWQLDNWLVGHITHAFLFICHL